MIIIRSAFALFLVLLCLSNCGKDKSTNTPPPNAGPIAFYPFNANAHDSTGNSYNGGMIGDPTFVSDRFGIANSALQMNGSGQYVYLPQNINIAADLSISFWIQTTISDSHPWPYATFVIDRDECNSSIRDWSVTMGLGGKLMFNTGAGGADSIMISNQDINDGNWKHIVVSRDHAARLKRIYINGQRDVSRAFDSQSFGNNDQSILFGASGCDTQSHTFFNGKLDDVRIYNRVLTETEIADLYHERGWPDSSMVRY
jgi:hypothetical protein